MKNLTLLTWIALYFVIAGGINCGLYGLLGFNFLEILFGIKFIGRLVFILVGVSAIYLLYMISKKHKNK